MLRVVCCLLFDVRCSLFVVRWLVRAVCPLRVVSWLLFVAACRCASPIVCGLMCATCFLLCLVACCVLFEGC